ncbi:SBBP repeat-containing protein [Methylobacter sp.]|uniref:DUF7948 domain-containing protein n=1 Tax=Methylobacter sp. TaxID=2051955 RepID=UPI003DA5C2DB
MEPNQCIATNAYSLRPACMALGVICLAFMSDLASAAPTAAPALKVQAQSNYGKLPLSFEINQGQTDAQVKFLARGQGYTLFLTPTEAVLSLKKPQARTKASPTSVKPSFVSETNGAMLRMQLIGANPSARILGKEALPGRVNYLIGKDPAKWRTKVPTYAKVAYEGVYPGVDLVYYGNQGQLEYDFVVAPGADPSRVKLAFLGANRIEVNTAGELILHTASGDVRMHKPVLYQEIDGVRKPVDGGYVLKGGQAVGFQVAAYDVAHSLTIDPVLVYSTYLGGSEVDTGQSIALDQRGQVYVTGITRSADFPLNNALQPDLGGDSFDAFVAKLTADGRALRYATYLGGSDFDFSSDIAVDKQGQAHVIGVTSSTDFPTNNALQPKYGGGSFDAFVAQLTADGAALRYSTYLGGNEYDDGAGIAIDGWGQASVTGVTISADFPIKNALQRDLGGGSFDAFVAKLTADGRSLRYSTYLGGNADDLGKSIAVDELGQAYLTGETNSVDFPTVNALQPSLGGGADAFVAKLTADGRVLRYSTYLGGSEFDLGEDIAVDEQGHSFVMGRTFSTNFPTKNPLQPTSGGNEDAFVVKLTTDGRELRYATYLGGNADDLGNSIAVDERGQAYLTGETNSADFPTVNALQLSLGGGADAFVAKLTADGGALRYSTYLGGSGPDLGGEIAVDQGGQVYVTGQTFSVDFPTENAMQPSFGGGSIDAFVAKISSDDRRCEPKKKCKDNHED